MKWFYQQQINDQNSVDGNVTRSLQTLGEYCITFSQNAKKIMLFVPAKRFTMDVQSLKNMITFKYVKREIQDGYTTKEELKNLITSHESWYFLDFGYVYGLLNFEMNQCFSGQTLPPDAPRKLQAATDVVFRKIIYVQMCCALSSKITKSLNSYPKPIHTGVLSFVLCKGEQRFSSLLRLSLLFEQPRFLCELALLKGPDKLYEYMVANEDKYEQDKWIVENCMRAARFTKLKKNKFKQYNETISKINTVGKELIDYYIVQGRYDDAQVAKSFIINSLNKIKKIEMNESSIPPAKRHMS